MKHILFIIAPKNFRDEELFEPKQILEDAGHVCEVVSTINDPCIGKLGNTAQPTLSLEAVDVADFDAIVLVGGPGAPQLNEDFRVISLIREAHEKNKIISAICIAPTILAKMGILRNRKATVFHSDKNVLLENECAYVEEAVVVDKKKPIILTANGPEASEAFGQKLLELLTA